MVNIAMLHNVAFITFIVIIVMIIRNAWTPNLEPRTSDSLRTNPEYI